jgi:hypothetical protein
MIQEGALSGKYLKKKIYLTLLKLSGVLKNVRWHATSEIEESDVRFIFGKNVKPGITGNNPIIPATVSVNDNVPMQIDFRAIYASILKYWFKVSDSELSPLLLNKTFPLLDIIADGSTSTAEFTEAKIGVLENYPNPATTQTTIKFTCSGGYVKIRLFDNIGREILTVTEDTYSRGTHEVILNTESLNNGTYYYQLQQGASQLMKTLIVAK